MLCIMVRIKVKDKVRFEVGDNVRVEVWNKVRFASRPWTFAFD